MTNNDKFTGTPTEFLTIEGDIGSLKNVARRMLDSLKGSAGRIDFLAEGRKISVVRELMILTEILLKLDQAQKELDSSVDSTLSAPGRVLSEAEMGLLESFLARMNKKKALPVITDPSPPKP